MYEELYIKLKNGDIDWYSPLNEMALSRSEDSITISWYGTVSIFSEVFKLEHIEELQINKIDKYENQVESNIIFNKDTDCICEFDNLNNSTYGILKYGGK